MTDVAAPAQSPKKPGILEGFKSWRLASVSLLSISSGMPLGVVWILTPFWLKTTGVDIKTIGFLTLSQAPWGFKFLWSPFMDRFVPPFLGRKRGWVLLTQVLVAFGTAALAAQTTSVEIGAVAGVMMLIAFAGASQDIAYDAWTVEVLEPSERNMAAAARTGMYRLGMWLSGNIAITLGPSIGWGTTFTALALIYIAFIPVTLLAPEPQHQPVPVKTLREAVWEPFVAFLSRPIALQLIGFILTYRMADMLAQSLTSPFLKEMGYSDSIIGIERGTIVLFATMGGAFLGGVFVNRWGLTRSLWLLGIPPALAGLSFAAVAVLPPNRPLVYTALILEAGTVAMASSPFGVLFLRLTSKRYSATQFALFTSLMGIARAFMGAIAGVLIDAVGWRNFFFVTVVAVAPGLYFLKGFAPWGKEPQLDADAEGTVEQPGARVPWPAATLWLFGGLALVAGVTVALLSAALLAAVKHWRDHHGFDFVASLIAAATPQKAADALDLFGALAFGLIFGLAVAAYHAARGRRNL